MAARIRKSATNPGPESWICHEVALGAHDRSNLASAGNIHVTNRECWRSHRQRIYSFRAMLSLCCRTVSNWCHLIDPAIFPAAAQRHMLSPTTYARRCAGTLRITVLQGPRRRRRPARHQCLDPEGTRMRSRTLTLLAVTVSTGLVLTACGANSSDS